MLALPLLSVAEAEVNAPLASAIVPVGVPVVDATVTVTVTAVALLTFAGNIETLIVGIINGAPTMISVMVLVGTLSAPSITAVA